MRAELNTMSQNHKHYVLMREGGLDDVTIEMVVAEQEVREKIIYLSNFGARGAQLRKGVLELMVAFECLKKANREFHDSLYHCDDLALAHHPLQHKMADLKKLDTLISQAKENIKLTVGDMSPGFDTKRVERDIDDLLVMLVAKASFYLGQAPRRH